MSNPPKRGTPPARQDSPLILGSFLPYRLSVLSESVSRAFAARYERRFGITIPEWRVMAVLGEHSSRTTQEVIALTRMDRVKVSRAVRRMVDRGLIARSAQPHDGRAHSLRLSRRGKAIYAQVVPLAYTLQAELTVALDRGELQRLDAMITRLLSQADRLASAADDPAS